MIKSEMTLFQAVVVTIMGVMVIAVGVIGVLRPYRFALWKERLDAVGSNRPIERIEPTDLNVKMTKFQFYVFVAGGLIILGLAYEEWQQVL